MRVNPVERLTIRPPSASSGSSAWLRKKTPLKWTSTSRSNCASVVSDQGIVAVSGIVDEVIKCIALPSLRERRTQPIHKGRKSRDVAGVQLKRDCPAAHCPNL